MKYLTYEEYVDLGGTNDETLFNLNITRTFAIVDRYTQSRIQGMAVVPDRVKTLCRDLVDYLISNIKLAEKTVSSKSESAGTVSESVTYSVKSEEYITFEIDELVYDHLYMLTDDNGTPLLYKGAMI